MTGELAAGPAPVPRHTVPRTLGDAVALRAQADTYVTARVAEARRAGRSWAEIAAVLGVTRQAARQRYVRSSPARPRRAAEDRPEIGPT